jgi:hypothetical protein
MKKDGQERESFTGKATIKRPVNRYIFKTAEHTEDDCRLPSSMSNQCVRTRHPDALDHEVR